MPFFSRKEKLKHYNAVAKGDMTTSNGNTDSIFYLSATVEPADADEQELEWSVAFKNSSGWASGKTASSYVTVSPTSDTHNATITCLGDFGEQIIITVRSKDNPNATAICQFVRIYLQYRAYGLHDRQRYFHNRYKIRSCVQFLFFNAR